MGKIINAIKFVYSFKRIKDVNCPLMQDLSFAVSLYVLKYDYIYNPNFIKEAYQHRLNAIEEIKRQGNFNSLKSENIYEVINALKSIPPSPPVKKIHIEIPIKISPTLK